MKVIKNFSGGLSTSLNPANIRDDEFSQLVNMFCWRGYLRPKAGNTTLGALTVVNTQSAWTTLDSSGNGSFNALTGLPSSAYVSSQTLLLSDGVNSYSQSSTLDGTLTSTGTATGTINYATGAITISGGAPDGVISGSISLCLGLPVMGIANWVVGTDYFPILWDTTYAYTYDSEGDVAFPATSTFFSSGNLCSWHGQNYNLFSYVNFANSLWCTNTVATMQFKNITAITTGVSTTVTIANHGLVVNDYVWFNEIVGTSGLNGQTGKVTSIVNSNQFVVDINSSAMGAYTSGGIAQYLTSNVPFPNADGIRYFYDSGWVNYAPPINSFVAGGDAVEYICGCGSMIEFKGRLCLFNVYIATAANAALGNYTKLASTMFYSSIYGINFGSPYYTSANPINAVNAGAFYPFPAGVYGGSLDFGINQVILGAINWKLDYVFVTFLSYRIRLFSTSSPITPFGYTRISSQYGGCNYTSAVALDQAVFDLSTGGFVASTATNVQRFDLDILDLYLSVSTVSEGLSRVCSYNDEALECLFFTFPSVNNAAFDNIFPDTSLLYNYRNNTWALIDSSFTSYGVLPSIPGGFIYGKDISFYTKPWSYYTALWDAQGVGTGATYRVAGNQCGYIFDLGDDSGFQNDISLPIAAINGSNFTIYNHNLSVGKIIRITNCVGVTGVNDALYIVEDVISQNEVTLGITGNSGTYLGLGTAAVVDNFVVRTKEFNDALEMAQGISIGNMWIQLQLNSTLGAAFSASAFADTSSVTSSFGSTALNYIPIYFPALSSAPNTLDGFNNAQITQSQVWKQVVVNSSGSSVSLLLTRLPSQILAANTFPGPVWINAIILAIKTGARLVN